MIVYDWVPAVWASYINKASVAWCCGCGLLIACFASLGVMSGMPIGVMLVALILL